MSRISRRALILLGLPLIAGILVVGGVIGYRHTIAQKNPIPEAVLKKTTFPVFLPNKKVAAISKDTVNYNPSERVLTYTVYDLSGTRIVVSQQAQPEIFNEEGRVYSSLLDKMKQYKQINTSLGTVTLTRPEELKGGQTAVINTLGTLFFARPDKDLTETQWQNFFNSFEKAS